jgi:peptidoglycan hydrolase CwlO-like protein
MNPHRKAVGGHEEDLETALASFLDLCASIRHAVDELRSETAQQRVDISELENSLKSLRSSIVGDIGEKSKDEVRDVVVDSNSINEAISNTVSALRDKNSSQRARISELENLVKLLRSNIPREGDTGDVVVDSNFISEAITNTVSALREENSSQRARISELENSVKSLAAENATRRDRFSQSEADLDLITRGCFRLLASVFGGFGACSFCAAH